MTNNDFAIAVNKFFYYAMNYDSVQITYPTLSGEETAWLPDFFNAFDKSIVHHLWKKYKMFDKNYGSRGAMMAFYAELDGDNRMKLCRWINENYHQREDFGINLEDEVDA